MGGKRTDKLLAHDKTFKRVNAMEWADELAKETAAKKTVTKTPEVVTNTFGK